METTKVEGPVDGFNDIDLESITSKYCVRDEEFSIVLSGGEVLTFRPLPRKCDLDAFFEEAATWYASLPKPDSEFASVHPWSEWLPRTAAEASDAFTISRLSVNPKIDELTALKWLRAPWLIREIMDGISFRSKTNESIRLIERVKAAKEKLEGNLWEQILLRVSLDHFGKKPDDLTEAERECFPEYLALELIEGSKPSA